MNKKVLVVVDYQRDFASPDGALYVPEAENISERIQKEINDPSYDEIIYTLDTHIPKEYKTSEEAKMFPEHCVFNTKGWNFFNIKARNEAINKALEMKIFDKPSDFSIGNEHVFVKDKFSIWEGNSNYLSFIDNTFEKDNTEIFVCGVATNYCVFENVMGYHEIGFYNISVIEEATKSIIDDTLEEKMNIMKNRYVKFV